MITAAHVLTVVYSAWLGCLLVLTVQGHWWEHLLEQREWEASPLAHVAEIGWDDDDTLTSIKVELDTLRDLPAVEVPEAPGRHHRGSAA